MPTSKAGYFNLPPPRSRSGSLAKERKNKMLAIGADVHKKSTTFFALDEEGEPLADFNRRFRRVRSDRAGYAEVGRYLQDRDYQVLMENSSKTHDTCWIMEELAMNVIVGHSPDLKKITQSDRKTDDLDAEQLAVYLLARFAGAKQFSVCYMCSKETMMDRQLCRTAKDEMMDEGRLKRQVRSHGLTFGIDLDMFSDLRSGPARRCLHRLDDLLLNHLVGRLEDGLARRQQLEEQIVQRFAGKPTYERIDRIPYFGPVTAAYLTSFIADIGRFRDAKAFVAALGLAPRERNSGEKVSHCHITKKGDPHARWLLIQSTIGHVRGCPDSPVTAFFNRKNGGSLAERKERGEAVILNRSAIVAAAAKMAAIIYTLEAKDRQW